MRPSPASDEQCQMEAASDGHSSAASPPSAAWGVRDVTVRYGRRTALAGVTLRVDAGTVTAVVGGDGSGKSTLLRCLAGLATPAAGTVQRPDPLRLGYVSGGGGTYQDLTVEENLAFVARAYRVPAARFARRREELLAASGLSDARQRLAGRLSGGMRQKLAVVLSLLHEPRLLVLDEPTTGVDPVSRAELWRIFAAAVADGTGILLATTYVDEAERALHVCALHDGRVLLRGSPADIVADLEGCIHEMPSDSCRRPPGMAWRRGSTWRLYTPGGLSPVGDDTVAAARPTAATLEDAIVVAAWRDSDVAQEVSR